MGNDIGILFMFPLLWAMFSVTVMDMVNIYGVFFGEEGLWLNFEVEGYMEEGFLKSFIIGDVWAWEWDEEVSTERGEVFGELMSFDVDLEVIFRQYTDTNNFVVMWVEACSFKIDECSLEGDWY